MEMIRKKEMIFIILLIVGIFLISFVSSAQESEEKISKEVYDKLNEEGEVNVIIKTKSEKKVFGIKIADVEEIKKEIIEDLELDKDKLGDGKSDEKIRDYQDLISVKVSEQELQELEQNPDVDKISYSHPIKAFLQDSVLLINAGDVWNLQVSDINLTGIDETICVLDTGINFSHPDLIGKNKTCVIDCFNKNCVENCSISDDNEHGTHVAGIVAANGGIKGVSIESDLIGVKVLDENGDGSGTGEIDLVNAIGWCVQNRDTYNISVITMSLGTSPPFLYDDYCDSTFTNTWTKAINNASFYNISVIVATGNNDNFTHISAPACVQNATSVGATTKDDEIASYSNRNIITDLFAPGGIPGGLINSTNVIGGYIGQYGTSMATPHIAGAFALLKQYYRLQQGIDISPLQIQSLLNSTGKQINDENGQGLNFSRINIYNAIDSLTNKTVTVNFISPVNNTYTNENQTFVCNSSSNQELANISFYIWNSTALVYNLTQEISGESNSSLFDYNFSLEDSYLWNCIAYNQEASSSNENYTITYDVTFPNITLIGPDDSGSYTSNSQSISFSYNISDINLNNCSLIINNVIDLTNSSINQSLSQSFTQTFSPGTYNWKINCSDLAKNQVNSTQRSFIISAPEENNNGNTGSRGGSGGSSGSEGSRTGQNTTTPFTIYKTYIAKTEQIINGYTKELKQDEKIKFKFKEDGLEHILTTEHVGKDFINISIKSEIVKLRLEIGESKEVDLDSDKLFVKLNSINEGKVNITIKSLESEPQMIQAQTGKASLTGKIIENYEDLGGNIKMGIFFVIITIIVALIFFRQRRLDKKVEIAKQEHKEKFDSMKPKKSVRKY